MDLHHAGVVRRVTHAGVSAAGEGEPRQAGECYPHGGGTPPRPSQPQLWKFFFLVAKLKRNPKEKEKLLILPTSFPGAAAERPRPKAPPLAWGGFPAPSPPAPLRPRCPLSQALRDCPLASPCRGQSPRAASPPLLLLKQRGGAGCPPGSPAGLGAGGGTEGTPRIVLSVRCQGESRVLTPGGQRGGASGHRQDREGNKIVTQKKKIPTFFPFFFFSVFFCRLFFFVVVVVLFFVFFLLVFFFLKCKKLSAALERGSLDRPFTAKENRQRKGGGGGRRGRCQFGPRPRSSPPPSGPRVLRGAGSWGGRGGSSCPRPVLTHPWLMLLESSLSSGVPVGSPLLHPLGQTSYPPAPAPGTPRPRGSCPGHPKNRPDVWEEEGDG